MRLLPPGLKTRTQKLSTPPRIAPIRTKAIGPYVSSDIQAAYKALPYKQDIADFINDQSPEDGLYSERQLESAYRTSVYMFAALRRVANLFSRVPIVGEIKRGNAWERLPETHELNRLIKSAGTRFLYETYIYYAMYGAVLIYKRKTIKAKEAEERGKTLWKYLDGAVSGLTVIPNAHWELVEDGVTDELLGFDLYRDTQNIAGSPRINRKRAIYWHDFDMRYRNRGISIVSLGLNDAVTNGAISRWAAHYFMSGAMPMLLVMPETDDPSLGEESDLRDLKSRVENLWRGIFGRFSLRANFFDRKLRVEEVGITADKVTAPELDRKALNALTSIFGISPDLIVPPEGGSQSRHKELIKEAYDNSVLPSAEHFVSILNEDLGFDDECPIRLVIAEDQILALEADRQGKSETEISIYSGGAQTLGDTQRRLNIEPIKALDQYVTVNGRAQSVKRTVYEDGLPNTDYLTAISTAWNDGAIRLSDYWKALYGKSLPSELEDGRKFEVVIEPGMGGGGVSQFASGTPSPEMGVTPPTPTSDNGEDAEPPLSEQAAPKRESQGQTTDGDKSSENVTPPAPVPVEMMSTGKPVLPAPPAAEPEDAPKNKAYVYLQIGDDSLIQTVQEQLEMLLGGADVRWEPRERWHCTLAVADDCPDSTLEAVCDLLPSNIDYLPLRIEGLRTFNTPDGVALCLNIVEDNELADLQRSVVVAFAAHMIQISEHSRAGAYNPHITLGYLDENIVPDFKASIVVTPSAVVVGRDNYQTIREIKIGGFDDDLGIDEEPNAIEDRPEWKREIEIQRRRMRALVRHWDTTSEMPPAMPERLREAISEVAGADGNVVEAIMRSINAGHFDQHSEYYGNPIADRLRKQNAKQKSATHELVAWRRYALRPRNGAAKAAERFSVTYLPLDIEHYVRDSLKAIPDKDRTGITEVFNNADRQLEEATAVPEITQATLEEWAARLEESGDDDLLELLADEGEV